MDFSPKLLEERIKRGNVGLELPGMSDGFINGTRFINTAQVEGLSAPYPAVTYDKPYTEFPLARFMAYSPMWY